MAPRHFNELMRYKSHVCAIALFSTLVACGSDRKSTVHVERGVDNSQRATEIVDGLRTVILECPDRVWPGLTWKDFTVFLSDQQTKEAFKWEASSPELLSPVDFASVPPELTSSFYGIGGDKDKLLLGLSLNLTATENESHKAKYGIDSAIGLGIHEGFHHTEQATWQGPADSAGQSRDTVYPLEARPRYLRYLMLKAMNAYLAEPKSQLLGQLSTIHAQYALEFPDEARGIKHTDYIEGSAQYVEKIGEAIALKGCDASEAELIETATKASTDSNSIVPAADGESYGLGLASGLIMRSLEVFKGWEAELEDAQTPLSILTARYPQVAFDEDPLALAEAQRVVSEENQVLAVPIDRYIAIKADPESVAIFIPFARMLGSFSLSKFVKVPSAELSLFVDFKAKFSARDGLGKEITVSSSTESVNSPLCGDEGVVFYHSAGQLGDLQSGILSVQSPELQADGAPFLLINDSGGRRWVCL